MSLKAILAKIENDGKEKAEEIINSAKKERKEILLKEKSILKERQSKDVERINRKVEAHLKQMSSHIVRETEKALLSHRRKIVDAAINDAVKSVASSSDYLDLMASLLEICDLTGTVEVLICKNDSSRITDKFLEKLSSKNRKFVLAEDKHTDFGGIIMRSGDISMNATLSMIAELNHDSMVMELSRLLPLEGQGEQ